MACFHGPSARQVANRLHAGSQDRYLGPGNGLQHLDRQAGWRAGEREQELMPKRTDIHKILILGSGPIIISQACEFDYSGTQACKALREEGYEIVLINSNPATIMTDPETAHRTYVEPITPEAVAKVIRRERPDAILPTLGGTDGVECGGSGRGHGGPGSNTASI